MAEVFSPSELDVLRKAYQANALSEDQMAEIVRRSQAPNPIGPPPVPQKEPETPMLEGPAAPDEFSIKDDRPESLSELSHGFLSRPTFEAVGGMGGAALSLPGAPLAGPAAPVVPLAGGALGSAEGSVAYDAINNFLMEQGVVKGEMGLGKPAVLPEITQDAVDAARWDAVFGAGASVIRPILGARRLIGKISGVFRDEAQLLMNMARDKGIDLGIADIGGSVPKGFLKTVSVFPFSSTPAAKAQIAKQGQAIDAVERVLDDLAPTATISTDLGLDLSKAAQATRGEFVRVSGDLYTTFRELAKKASVKEIIPTEESVKTATELYGEIAGGEIKIGTGNRARTLESPSPEAIVKFERYISDLQELPGLITIQQYQKQVQDLGAVMDELSAAGLDVRRAGMLKKAFEGDLNNIRADLLPTDEANAIKAALKTANNWFSKGIVDFSGPVNVPPGFKGQPTFETPTAGKFERADKRIFQPGAARPGTINEDELYSVVTNLRSPQAITDLRALVGDDAMRSVARRHLQTAAEQSTVTAKIGSFEETIIDPYLLEKNLGLAGTKLEKNLGLEKLLEISGAKVEDVKNLITSMKSIEDLGDPSSFVRRRAILGGSSAVLGASAGFGGSVAQKTAKTAGVAAFALTAGTITLLTRHISKIFTSPDALKNVLEALDTARDTTARQAAFGRILKFVGQDKETGQPEQ